MNKELKLPPKKTSIAKRMEDPIKSYRDKTMIAFVTQLKYARLDKQISFVSNLIRKSTHHLDLFLKRKTMSIFHIRVSRQRTDRLIFLPWLVLLKKISFTCEAVPTTQSVPLYNQISNAQSLQREVLRNVSDFRSLRIACQPMMKEAANPAAFVKVHST